MSGLYSTREASSDYTRTMLRRVVVALLLALPWEAHTSGSSTVTAQGAHLAVSLESARKIFDARDGGHEMEWHAEWVRENQSAVDAALPRLEPALKEAAAKEGVTLAGYDAALPEAWAWASPEHDRSPERVCVAGCRIRLQLWSANVSGAPAMEVEVAVGKAPPPGALGKITEALARAVVDP